MLERGTSKEGRFTSAAGAAGAGVRGASVEGRFTSITSCLTSLIGVALHPRQQEHSDLRRPLNNPRTNQKPLLFPHFSARTPLPTVRFRKPKSQNRKTPRAREGATDTAQRR